jgi:putative ABC transport system permease protein
VFAGPLLHHSATVVLVTSKRLFGTAGEFAVDNLIQGAGRGSLTVATLGVGLGAVLMFGILGWSFERTLVSQLTGRLRADLVVTSSFVSDGYRPSSMGDAVLESLRATPGVVLVTAEQERDVPYGSSTVLLDAYDGSCFIDTRACYWELNPGSLPNALVRVARGEAVLVSSSFSHQHGARPGDFVELEPPAGPIRLQVAGVTSGQPVSAVLMCRDYYQRLWNDALVTWVHVTLDPTAHRAEIDATIARRLGERYRIMVRSSADLVAYFAAQARQAFRFTYMLEAITFLLVSLAIADTLASGVVERTRQFGMMRAVGLHRAALFTIVMLEGTAIGALGLFLASLTGLALGAFWVQIQFPDILGWRLDMHVPLIFILIATALTMLLCVAGSLLPALQAARLGVPQALRNE